MANVVAFLKHRVTTHSLAVVLGAASVALASYASTGHVDVAALLRSLGY